MQTRPCPENWDYETHPNKNRVGPRSADLVKQLRTGAVDVFPLIQDSRPMHRALFAGLTPEGFDYFAGSYRGSEHYCLKDYRVGVRSDSRVGAPPAMVSGLMQEFAAEIRVAVTTLDLIHESPNSHVPREMKLLTTATVACRALEVFLQIHPYANGNGHTARLIVLAILGRYGYWPARWTIEPRPKDVPYLEMIMSQREGAFEVCEQAMMKCMIGD